MVDFNKLVIYPDKFRQAAIFFQAHGEYCLYPENTTEYIKFWDEETHRCLYGYTAKDGDYISGYNYFYLNYAPIQAVFQQEYKNSVGQVCKQEVRDTHFAAFYDYDYYYFNAVEEAEKTGQHMSVLKARGKGYSFKGASMLCRNYYLIPNSKSYAVASEKEYLINDGLLSKAWEMMDFIDEHTAWSKKRLIDNSMHRRSGIEVTNEVGNKTQQGYKSEIIGISLKNNPDRIRGKRGKLILWEEAGMFSNILQAWQIARPGIEHNGVAFGLMIAYGTGGSEGDDFRGLRELFYNGSGYNLIQFQNIWDENMDSQKCGFFVPEWSNNDLVDDNGKYKYMDSYGNSRRYKSIDYALGERKKVVEGSTDNSAIDRYIAEHPIHPMEACLEISGNIFPKKELTQQLALIRSNKKLRNFKQVGELLWVNGTLSWQQKHGGDITQYPLPRDADPTGSIVIWEHPVKDPPFGLYIAGTDPYDHDQSQTNSLGSTFIYKRFQNFESYYDIIVAEYTGRPATAEDYYENVHKLLIYYNARLLYENQCKGLATYFKQHHCDYLLVDQPDIISDIVGDSKVHRGKGIHMIKEIRQYGEGLIKEWLNAEYAPGKKNLTKIFSEPLLEELIQTNGVINVDRVIALCMVMIYREQLYNIKIDKAKEENKKRSLFELPVFTDRWFSQSDEVTSDNTITPLTFNL